ncbi:putative adenylyltransferase/sulfurtransferase MoeZ [Aquimixticola soesokkakensis]|uniref:Molybdopterin-synthase adenylyltransferase n=1 Tax=Aquimixticola soesokkakensis TaxID=1519096 RepID=A0A1Y5T0C8_9RHOB|nr:HesA/MoeB/ThiF family protein [Aquimixticola soesokkakensis]SLN53321.1 putative adenylyltransferase/sulfurtransferase MoeZ [Aquimixticola soesokkakensis]
MLIFIVLSVAIWAVGAQMRLPRRLRWALIGVLYLGVLLAMAVLPQGSNLRAGLGESFAEWAMLGVLAALVWGYRRLLRRIRARVAPPAEVARAPLEAADLTRYARHILLREIGGMGQKRLQEARVLVVGAGGLGSPVIQYLAAAGVGTLGVIDDDVVEGSNLQRQVIHTPADIDLPKVFSATRSVAAQNPSVVVKPYNRRFDASTAALVQDYDLVIDGTDTFETRYAVNAACVAGGVALISGAIGQWEGQVSLFHPASGGPCYQCLFPQAPAAGLAPSCAEGGVVGPLPGVIGTMMALEAVKHLTGAGDTLAGRLLIWDGLYAENRVIKIARRADCACCGARAA